MQHNLDPIEARIIGCLIEKEITTPDQYPLSINALTNACNQKSNRDPVMELAEAQVQQVVDALLKRHLVSDRSTAFGGRVTRYKHRFANTEFGVLKFDPQEMGVVCVMLLRGPQTAGELRTRTNRLCEFADAGEVEATLARLMAREDGPFVARLARSPGERESRYMHLFSGAIESVPEPAAPVHAPAHEGRTSSLQQRVEDLELQVLELQEEMAALRSRVMPADDA